MSCPGGREKDELSPVADTGSGYSLASHEVKRYTNLLSILCHIEYIAFDESVQHVPELTRSTSLWIIL